MLIGRLQLPPLFRYLLLLYITSFTYTPTKSSPVNPPGPGINEPYPLRSYCITTLQPWRRPPAVKGSREYKKGSFSKILFSKTEVHDG
jgi:hypothetical protein